MGAYGFSAIFDLKIKNDYVARKTFFNSTTSVCWKGIASNIAFSSFASFCIIVAAYFQNLVNKMWIGLASQDKMEIRGCLPKLLLAQHKSVPYFIRNKLCKVIVDIGRQDWPMFYHDFFTNTLQVSPADTRCLFGERHLKYVSYLMICLLQTLQSHRFSYNKHVLR